MVPRTAREEVPGSSFGKYSGKTVGSLIFRERVLSRILGWIRAGKWVGKIENRNRKLFMSVLIIWHMLMLSWSSRYNICDHKLLPPMTENCVVSLWSTVFHKKHQAAAHSSPTDQAKASGDRKCTRVCTARVYRRRTLKTNVLQPEWMSKNHNKPQKKQM